MRKKLFIKMSVLLVILALTAQISFAKDDVRGSKSLNKTLGTPGSTRLNINKISTLLNANGLSDVNGSNPGYYYPTLSGKTANFVSGLVFGAYLGPVSDNVQRVTGSAYRTSLTPGRILSPGVADNATNSNVRIYRVRRDYKTGSVGVEALDEAKSEADIRAQYEKDWNEWPALWGAPFEDIGVLGADGQPVKDAQGNNVKDGKYDPLIDIPGVPGADQTVWWVANDLSLTQAATFYGSTPMGVELQCAAWGYRQAGALGSMIFKKYTIINKNANKKDFNNAYVAYFSDTDIGGGSFDFSACDTTLSLFYTYSSNNTNAQYGGNPPATGFDFFQGPKYKTGNVQDTAIFNGKYLVGWKNQPMSSHFYFINSDATMADPDQNTAVGIAQWYNLFQGKVGVTGAAYIDPYSLKATKFPLAGDPTKPAGVGNWLDGKPYAAADRRNGGAAGPFNIAYGDTQEVVVAQISAGASGGLDNIGAVSQLKEYDKTAQIAYNRLFKLPQPAPAPKLTVSSFDQKLLLNWGNDASAVNATEGYDVFGYAFQGYNVYQLPTASSTISDGKIIKTFDVVDGVTYVLDKTTDAASGALVDYVAANGSDNGINRTFEVTKDFLTGSKLFNGSRYYFAVTSYSYNPAPPFGPKVLENPLAVITAIPNKPAPGYVYTSTGGQVIPVTKTGSADGTVTAVVVDPSKVTGHNYQVTFGSDANGTAIWNLKDVTSGKVVLANQSNLSGDGNYINIDGILVKAIGPEPGVKTDDVNSTADTTKWGWNVKGTRRWTYLNADPNGYGFTSFGNIAAEGGVGTLGWWSVANFFNGYDMTVKATELKKVMLKHAKVTSTDEFNPAFDLTDPNMSYGYRYLRAATAAPAQAKFAPYILNKVAGTYPFQEFAINIPMSAWNIEDPKNPKRLAMGFLENNSAGGYVDGKYWPPYYNNITDNTGTAGPREWLFIMDEPYTTTPNAVYTKLIGDAAPRVMYSTCWLKRQNTGWTAASGTDQFFIYPNHVFAATDVFSFTAPSVAYSDDQAKADIENINVYPNPYYGVNAQELTKYTRWVTFTHLPPKATLRIFNLAGQLVKTIVKDNSDQSQRWDLLNDNAFPVGSGLFIVHIDMPDLGKSKILKVAIIQEQQILDRF